MLFEELMPAWIHNRAEHILSKNPAMPKSQAFAIATQQSHATGHTPGGYGTAEGKQKAKRKYRKSQSEYTQTADPSSKSKTSSLAFLKGFSDEMKKIAANKRRDPSKPFLNSRPVPDSLPPPLATSAGDI